MDARTPERLARLRPDGRGSAILSEPGRSLLDDSPRRLRSPGSLLGARGTMPLREGLAWTARSHALLLVEPGADPDDGDPRRPWFPDYEEVE